MERKRARGRRANSTKTDAAAGDAASRLASPSLPSPPTCSNSVVRAGRSSALSPWRIARRRERRARRNSFVGASDECCETRQRCRARRRRGVCGVAAVASAAAADLARRVGRRRARAPADRRRQRRRRARNGGLVSRPGLQSRRRHRVGAVASESLALARQATRAKTSAIRETKPPAQQMPTANANRQPTTNLPPALLAFSALAKPGALPVDCESKRDARRLGCVECGF